MDQLNWYLNSKHPHKLTHTANKYHASSDLVLLPRAFSLSLSPPSHPLYVEKSYKAAL
jgi:hypothetical protein